MSWPSTIGRRTPRGAAAQAAGGDDQPLGMQQVIAWHPALWVLDIKVCLSIRG